MNIDTEEEETPILRPLQQEQGSEIDCSDDEELPDLNLAISSLGRGQEEGSC